MMLPAASSLPKPHTSFMCYTSSFSLMWYTLSSPSFSNGFTSSSGIYTVMSVLWTKSIVFRTIFRGISIGSSYLLHELWGKLTKWAVLVPLFIDNSSSDCVYCSLSLLFGSLHLSFESLQSGTGVMVVCHPSSIRRQFRHRFYTSKLFIPHIWNAIKFIIIEFIR